MTPHGIPANQQPSPAAPSATAFGVTANTRIPMGGGRQKLAVPNIPGYHPHWFVDAADRIASAIASGYEFVTKTEVAVNNHGIGADRDQSEGTDLGSRVSIVAGGTGESNQALRLVLMKIRNEWRTADMRKREEAADRLIAALTRGQAGATEMPSGSDTSNRYLGMEGGRKPNPRSMFIKRT